MVSLSVVIPAYNAENTIEKCVQSICAQNYKDIEIIIIEDGSVDGTALLCDKFAEKDKRIRVVHSENGGVSKARNQGIHLAMGKYLRFVDSDDYLEADCIANEITCIESEEADWLISGYKKICGTEVKEIMPLQDCCCTIEELENQFANLYENMLLNVPWNKIYRREKIVELFHEEYSLGEDVLFNFEYMKRCKKIVLQRHCGYCFNSVQSGSLRRRFRKNDLFYASEIYSRLLEAVNGIWGKEVCTSVLSYIYVENIKSILRRLITSECTAKEMRAIIRESMSQDICRGISRHHAKKGINKLILFCYENRNPFLLWSILTTSEKLKRLVEQW